MSARNFSASAGGAAFQPPEYWAAGKLPLRCVLAVFLLFVAAAKCLAQGGPPVITTQPQSQTVVVGSNATMVVAASSTTALTYQWFKDSGSIPGATSPTFTITNVQSKDAGSYNVLVVNSSGSVLSQSATLTVVSNAISLAAALDGAGFVWTSGGAAPWVGQASVTRDGVDAARSGTITHNQESFLQTTVTNRGSVSFFWKISSEAGFDSLQFFVGTNLQSSVSGEADWQQESFNIPAGINILRWRYVKDDSINSGQDKGWLDQVTFINQTLPVAIVSYGFEEGGGINVFDTTTNNYDGLLVNGPVFSFDSIAGTFSLSFDGLNDRADLPAAILSGRSERTIEMWIKTTATNGNIFDFDQWGGCCPRDQISINPNGTLRGQYFGNGDRALNGATVVNNGQWHHVALSLSSTGGGRLFVDGVLEAANTNGAAPPPGNHFTLGCANSGSSPNFTDFFRGQIDEFKVEPIAKTSLVLPPAITTQPTSQTVLVGANVIFSVTAISTSPLRYQWRHNGIDIVGATNNSLVLTDVQSDDEGNYGVVVSDNIGGFVTSRAATLTVLEIPSNDACSGAIPMREGEIYSLNTGAATSTGDPAPGCRADFGRGVWYTFTPTLSGAVTVSTCGSSFDTVVQVFTGTCTSLTPVTGACNDNNGPACSGSAASLTFSGVAGTTYRILAGGVGGTNGLLNITVSVKPPNDACSGAIALAAGVPQTVFTFGATSTGDPTPTCQTEFGSGVWFTFTPANSGVVVVSTCGSSFDTLLQVYRGTCTALTAVTGACNDDNGPSCSGNAASLSFAGIAGTTYRILAGGFGGNSGTLNIVAALRPANDACSGAIALTAGAVQNVNTFGATSTNDPTPVCETEFGRGIWYTFTPSISGPVTVSTCGSDFDTVLQVFSGACASLTPISGGCNDQSGLSCEANSAQVVFNGVAGTIYRILAGGFVAESGNLRIVATLGAPAPSNDACSGAIEMDPGVTYAASTASATATGDPVPICQTSFGRGVWYAFTPPFSGAVTISTCGSDFDTVLQVYTGNCGSLATVSGGCNDNNGAACAGNRASARFNGTAGTTYRILAGGLAGASGTLNIIATITPPNDACIGAIALTAGVAQSMNTSGATSTTDPAPVCETNFAKGVWYTFTPSVSGPVTVSTCGSDFDTVLQVYTGSCASLTPVSGGCNDESGLSCEANSAHVIFNGVAGTTYRILAGGYQGDAGTLSIVASDAGSPVITSQPQNQTVAPNGTVSFSVEVSGTVPFRYQWRFKGTDLVGATNAVLSLNNVQNCDAGSYSVFISNSGGIVTSSNAVLTVLGPAGSVYAWGDNAYEQAAPPCELGDAVAIAGAFYHSVALRRDGTVVAWGDETEGQLDVPPGLSNVTTIAAGGVHTLAVRSNGTVVAWGGNIHGQTNVPAGLSNVVAVAVGDWHNLALKRDGTVTAWGATTTNAGNFPNYGQSIVPAGLTNVIAIAAGGLHSLAVKRDGTVVAWGAGTADTDDFPNYGQSIVPAALRNVVAVAGGSYHSLALSRSGEVIGWGHPFARATTTPIGLSNVVAIAAGYFHNLALESDGTITAWGNNEHGETNVPAGLSNISSIAAGYFHGLALQGSAQTPATLSSPEFLVTGFRFRLTGPQGSYVIQASSNLVLWTSIATNAIPSSGVREFTDSAATNLVQRFYRALQQ